ncbi:MAG: glycosyltransferase [Candidatus Cloacimonetes bacterium]|nr:glycosyltransferase [Candidatus Cloacimonadota bacterium]
MRTLLKGGAEKQALLLTKLLQVHHDAFCVVFHGEQVDEQNRQFIERESIPVVRLTGSLPMKFVKLFRLLRSRRVEVLFTYLALCNVAGTLLAKLAGVRYVVNGVRSSRFSAHKIVLQRFIHNWLAHRTVCNSHSGYNEVIRLGFRTNKLLVIPNGIEVPSEPLIRRPSSEMTTILSVGRYSPPKDYPTALSAFAQLAQRHPEQQMQYIIIGFGELEVALREKIGRLGLEGAVHLVINPPDVHKYYRQADIYLCSSSFEGLSNSIMEAMAYALPVVATDVGDNGKLVLNNRSGFFCAKEDAAGLASALEKLVDSSEARESFGKAGWRHLQSGYSEQALLERYLSLINELVVKT